MENRKFRKTAVLVVATLVGFADVSHAQTSSTSTTSTTFGGTTTTTMFVPTDITGGGRFEGSFPKGSFDSYSFFLDEPRALVVDLTNGFGRCPGDSFIELRRPGGPGDCQGIYGDDLPCIAFDDDSGISLCSRLVHFIAEPGEYEVRVSAYRGGQLPRYFIDVEFVEVQCGNGQLEVTEACDDGNLAAGDCCSPTCTRDAPGTPCDDGLSCNGADTCSAGGSCTIHADDPCPGPDGDGNCSESCSDSESGCTGPDPGGSPCDDGIFCNGPDTCSDGNCSSHAGSPCDDGDVCTLDACNEASDLCTNTPLDPCPGSSVCGDLTGDGEVKASDALAVLRAAVGGNECAEKPCVCDANGSGTITAPDALLVLRVAVGVAIELQCPC